MSNKKTKAPNDEKQALADGTVKNQLQWKVNTPQLMKEILCNNATAILRVPLTIFSGMLAEVGERASEINDPKLNALMCRLAIYEVSDPYNENYDAELTNATIEAGEPIVSGQLPPPNCSKCGRSGYSLGKPFCTDVFCNGGNLS